MTANLKPRRKRDAAVKLFPRGERGVVCGEDRMMRRPPLNRMIREDRHVTKRELAEMAA